MVLENISQNLIGFGISGLEARAFDNAFSVFNNRPEDNSLVLLGTNGNSSDEGKTNQQWLALDAQKPTESNLLHNSWRLNNKMNAKNEPNYSTLQKRFIDLPDQLNDIFGEPFFSVERMVLTNGLLLASDGVSDIKPKFNQYLSDMSDAGKEVEFPTLPSMIAASMNFFKEVTLKYSKPKLIIAYGNASGKGALSAWQFILDNMNVLSEPFEIIPEGKKYPVKFCMVEHNGHSMAVVSPRHMSWAPLDLKVAKAGLQRLGIL